MYDLQKKADTVEQNIDLHHIDYDKNNLDPDNFLPLCNSCHMRTNGHREYWTKVLQNIVVMNKSFRGYPYEKYTY